MRIRFLTTSVAILALLLFAAPAARATDPTCTYTPGEFPFVTAESRNDTFVRMFVDEGGQIKARFDTMIVDCGDATTANTASVSIFGSAQDDLLGISQNGPGGDFRPAIFFTVNGMGGSNELRLTGGPDSDRFRFGVDPADEGTAPAADLFESGDSRIRLLSIQFASARMLGGNDSVTGRPGEGFEGALTIPLDATGGRGNDEVTGGKVSDDLGGGAGADILKGLAGGDSLSGGAGGDDLSGGPGTDDCSGGPGNDLIRGCET